MSQLLRQSTATTIIIGPFVSETDGTTANTTMNVGGISLNLIKHNDTFGSVTNIPITATDSGGSNDMAHIANGYYKLELTSVNVDTIGRLRVEATSLGNTLPAWENFEVIDANAHGALISGTAIGTDDKFLISANGISNVEIAVSGANKIADHAIRRTMQNLEASNDGDTIDLDSLYGILARHFKVTVVGNVMTVFKSDGVSVLGTVALTTDSAADPITGVAAV